MTHQVFAAIKIYGCRYDVAVNGVPVAMNFRGIPCNLEVPVNHLLSEHGCTIDIRLVPLEGEETLGSAAECAVRLFTRDFSGAEEIIYNLNREPGSLNRERVFTNSDLLSLPVVRNTAIWEQGEVLDFTDTDLVESANSEFLAIWNLFAERNTQELLLLFDERMRYVERCFGLQQGERTAVFGNRVDHVFGDDGFILIDMLSKSFQLVEPRLSAQGRLVTLIERKERINFITYYNFEKKEQVEFPVYLGRPNDENTFRVWL